MTEPQGDQPQSSQPVPQPPPPPEESFLSHLFELRTRLVRAVTAFGLVLLGLLPFSNTLYTWLALPMLRAMPAGAHMIATEVTTPFFVPMKVAMMAALLVALPYVLWQAWAFVAPALYAHEKRLVVPLVVSSTLLFYLGMAFAYFAVFPVVFGFVNAAAPSGVVVTTDIDHYLGFVLNMFMAFGLAFEVPVAVVVLVRLGAVEVATLRAARRYVIVGAFVVGAIFTPPDVVSQSLLAIPLIVLFELGVFAAARWKPAGRP